MGIFTIRKDVKKNEEKKPTNKKATPKTKRVVQDDLSDTKDIISSLREVQKKVTALKRQGKNNPKLDKLLESISDESYKICLKC